MAEELKASTNPSHYDITESIRGATNKTSMGDNPFFRAFVCVMRGNYQ